VKELVFAGMLSLAASCGSLPQTHYYALALPPPQQPPRRGSAVLVVEELSVASAYEDQRIVYRPGPYRLEYYDYHQWSAPPALAIRDYVRDALARNGRFHSVTSERSRTTTLVLGGRLFSFEEVDVTPKHWVGRVELELFLEDPRSGERVWSRIFREERPLPARNAAGLAQALSAALSEIVAEATPEISNHAERTHRASTENPEASAQRERGPESGASRRRARESNGTAERRGSGQASASDHDTQAREP
jgi:ABC-type uncharacterized transport system auxiliary subunit